MVGTCDKKTTIQFFRFRSSASRGAWNASPEQNDATPPETTVVVLVGRPTTMSFDLYPPCIYEGDLSADAFGSDVDEVCQEIRAAVKGWGCDESEFIDCSTTANEIRVCDSIGCCLAVDPA